MTINEMVVYLDKAFEEDAEHFACCIIEWWPQIRKVFPILIERDGYVEAKESNRE